MLYSEHILTNDDLVSEVDEDLKGLKADSSVAASDDDVTAFTAGKLCGY